MTKQPPFHRKSSSNTELVDKSTKLVKQMGFYGVDPKAVKMKPGSPLTPDQLLSIQTMMGHVHGIPMTITLGANPQTVYDKALALDFPPVIELLEMHGAKNPRRPKKSHS